MQKIFFSVYEKSADFYSARLLKKLEDKFDITGFGGPEMKEVCNNVKNVVAKTAFMGLPIKELPYFYRLMKAAKKEIKNSDIVTLVDFSGLNLRLLKHVKSEGKKSIYFIPPKFWAWSSERAGLLKDCDCVFPLFKFEHEFLLERGIRSFYFGHPLSEELSEYKDIRRGNTETRKIGIFPGSRLGEIKSTLPIILKALKNINGDFRLFLAGESFEILNEINSIIAKYSIPIKFVLPENKYKEISTLENAIACSGTVALELSYFSVPTIVVYRTNWLNYMYFKNKVRVKYFSLPNIIANEEVFPELIQNDFTPQNIEKIFMNLPEKKDFYSKCDKIWENLYGENIFGKIANKIQEVCS